MSKPCFTLKADHHDFYATTGAAIKSFLQLPALRRTISSFARKHVFREVGQNAEGTLHRARIFPKDFEYLVLKVSLLGTLVSPTAPGLDIRAIAIAFPPVTKSIYASN